MATRGEWERTLVNGQELTGDSQGATYKHAHLAIATPGENIGYLPYSPGRQDLDLTLANWYRRRGQGVSTAHNLFYPSGVGNVNDTEFIFCAPRGSNAAPAVGDVGYMGSFTRLPYTPKNALEQVQRFDATFKSRGKLAPPFPVLIYDGTGLKTATNFSSTPYDDGAEGNGTLLGAEACLQIYAATGVAASGTITVTGQPSDADTIVINGVTYTFKTSLTPTAGQVLIGSTAADTLKNLWYALKGAIRWSGVKYAAGTTAMASTLIASVPTDTQLTITYALTGTAGNAITFTESASNLTITGAGTLTGGVAGDTYDVTLATATSSGGSYTTLVTWSGVGAVVGAFYSEIAIGTTINEFWKLTFTKASGAGTSQTFSAMCMVGRFFCI